jgi:hypothetical protein
MNRFQREELKLMSKLVDAMTALGTQLAAANGQANADHFKAVDDHLASIDTKEGADEAQAADMQAFIDAASTPPVTTQAPPSTTVAPPSN